MKWSIAAEKVSAWINEDQCFCTNEEGNGVFFIDLVKNSRQQLAGTCQFSVRGVADKKRKFRKWIKEYRREI